jgi:hypothetical protein
MYTCVSHALAGPMRCSAVVATAGFSIINYRNTYHHTHTSSKDAGVEQPF